MKLFVTLTKKTLAALLAGTVIALVIISRVFSVDANTIDGSTNAKRVQFIRDLGYGINETAAVKETVIPQKFTKVYERYNIIEKQAGFDLTGYKGKKAVVYAYTTSDGEKTVTLIVVNGEIVGGDVSSVAFDGEMLPLIKTAK